MSHPNPQHDRSNEYPDDNYKPSSLKTKVAKKMSGKVTSGKDIDWKKNALWAAVSRREKAYKETERLTKKHRAMKNIAKLGIKAGRSSAEISKGMHRAFDDKAKTLKASHNKWQER